MAEARGQRIEWTDLPAPVRAAVERILGAPVMSAVSQAGGFSPGTADRVVTASHARAFVKVVGVELNAQSVELHRREAVITAALPASAHAPKLLGVYDDGEWIALVLEDVEGRSPPTPWEPADLDRVLSALVDVGIAPLPRKAADLLPRTVDDYADSLAGWERIAADIPVNLDPWAWANLDQLVDLGGRSARALHGGSLVHGDLRADNILLAVTGDVRLVDWPEASVGASWFDSLSVLVNVNVYGGHDVDALVERWLDVDDDEIDAVLAGFTGYFLDAARLPPPKGLPTVREFQAFQGARTLDWLRRRRQS